MLSLATLWMGLVQVLASQISTQRQHILTKRSFSQHQKLKVRNRNSHRCHHLLIATLQSTQTWLDRALHIKRASCSPRNFAVKLLPGVFTAQELAPLVSNCTGTKGKKALDQHKLRTIKELVMNLYDIPIKNQEEVWKGCVRAIDEFLRRSNRSRVQKKD